MGENVLTLGLYTLRDFNSTESDLKPNDHLFCITYSYDMQEREVMLIWKRGKRTFTRTLNHGVKLPTDTENLMRLTRLTTAAQRILNGEKFNLLDV